MCICSVSDGMELNTRCWLLRKSNMVWRVHVGHDQVAARESRVVGQRICHNKHAQVVDGRVGSN